MDEFLWNKLDIKPPPSMCVKLKLPQTSTCDIQQKLLSMYNEAKEVLLSKVFREEATFISRVLYRYKNQFRFLKGFQYLKKVYQALLRIPKLKMNEIFNELLHCTSKEFVPSSSMVEYAMLRLQSLSFLVSRVICTCQEVFIFIKSYIKGPTPWEIFFTFQASVSRLWVLCHHLLQKSDKWYETLSLLYSMSNKNEPWLPPTYNLPDNLLSWLNQQLVKNLQSPIVVENTYKLNSETSNSNNNESSSNDESTYKEWNISGVRINHLIVKEKKKKKRNRKFKPKRTSESTDIQTLNDLKKFLRTEITLRSNSNFRENCITKNLEPAEWDILQTILLKSTEKIEKKPETADKILGKVRQTLQLAIS